VSENQPPRPPEPADREDQAILAAFGVLEAGDPERALGDVLRPRDPAQEPDAEADVTLRRLYLETLGLLAWDAPAYAPPERLAEVRSRLRSVVAGGAAEPTTGGTAAALPPEARVVPIAEGRESAGSSAVAPRRSPWLTALAAAFAAGAVGLAGWFHVQLDRTQEALARLEADRARLAERLDRQEELIRKSAGMSDLVTAVSTAGVEICPLRPVGNPALHPKAFAVLYMPPGSGQWYLLASNLERGPGVYKVWLNTPNGDVPVGVLEPGADSALEFELPPDIDQRHELMLSITVTLEPSPDMPDPSGPMVLFGDQKMKVL
jgi:hypothetical protein